MALSAEEIVEVPVLIVGGGPVGLVQAIELARHNVSSMVVEATDGTIRFPTGESLNTRTMEHFRHWGIADQVRYSGFPPSYRRDVRFVTRVMGFQLACFERTGNDTPLPAETAVSPESSCWCPKFFLDPVLRSFASSFPQIDLRFGMQYDGLVETTEGIRSTIQDASTGRLLEVRSRFVVGCDGGSSAVRRTLGIELQGRYAEGQNLGVYFRAPSLLATNPFGPASQYWLVNRGLRGPLSAVDGREHWRLALDRSGPLDANVDPLKVVHSAIGAEIPVEILEVRPWAGHRLVAERYGTSRVFLAGDSAHLMWPRGGFGLNTGIGDAINLAWKLAAVLQGWGGAELLGTYELERRPVGIRNVTAASDNRAAEMAVPTSEHLESRGEVGERDRVAVGTLIEATRRKEWNSLGIQLGYHYGDSPICIPDDSPAPASDPSVYEPIARPGARAPHVWLDDTRLSTLDILGHGFTLMRLGRRPSEVADLERAAKERGVPLEVVTLGEASVAEHYEASLVLVRPDGHIAWRSHTEPRNSVALLGQVVGDTHAEPADGG